MIKYWIICSSPEVPIPEKLIEALHQKGHQAQLVGIGVRHHGGAMTVEIGIGAELSRVIVEIGNDFQEGFSIGDWEMVLSLLRRRPGRQERANIRRLASVRAWKHADQAVLQSLVETYAR